MASSHLSVDWIIKKYQQRQEQLTSALVLDQIDAIDTTRGPEQRGQPSKNGSQTPQFSSYTSRKEQQHFKDSRIERTHKKNQSYDSFNPRQHASSPFNCLSPKMDYQKLLTKLDQTEDQLTRSERNYADIWKKYQSLLQERGKKGEKSVEIEQQLREKEAYELQLRLGSLEKQNQGLREFVKAKEGNVSVLRDKLRQKNERIVELEGASEWFKSQLNGHKAKQDIIVDEADCGRREKDAVIEALKQQLSRSQVLIEEKDISRKQLLAELEGTYQAHKEQLQVLRMSYGKVEEEYKQWIEDCKTEKMSMIQDYEHKLKKMQKQSVNSSLNTASLQGLQAQLSLKNQTIQELKDHNSRLLIESKKARAQFQKADQLKQQLIIKVSTLQNNMVHKLQSQSSQDQAYSQLKELHRNQEDKNITLNQRLNKIRGEHEELKHRYISMEEELEEKKESKSCEGVEVGRLRKEVAGCREQIENARNNQKALSGQLAETLTTLKKKSNRSDGEKQELMTELMAQRLTSARLKEELEDTKVHLKKQYQLSIQNTRRQLEQQIRVNTALPSVAGDCDQEKQQLYLKLRQLERRYELLSSQLVSMDEMMSIAAKVQRRYQPRQ